MLDHEKLVVYQKTLKFLKLSNFIFYSVPKSSALFQQFDRASLSILLNIAEGNGKYSGKNKSRFFDIAKGSSLECGACLDAMVIKNFSPDGVAKEGKNYLEEIVGMLIGLIKANTN